MFRVRDLTDALRDREPVGVWLAVPPGTVPRLGDAQHPLDELAQIRLVSSRRPKAQTLILSPDILLMDEPFSALDVQTRQLMENELLALWAEDRKSVLFITHDLRLVERFCQRVLVMEHGRIVETATVSLPLRLRSPAGQALQQAVLPPFPATLLNEAMPCSA